MEYQLPRAVINVKQGAGRLIRTESDRGILMICDPRMLDKPYGRHVWRSLPPMRRTRERAVALAFFSPVLADGNVLADSDFACGAKAGTECAAS